MKRQVGLAAAAGVTLALLSACGGEMTYLSRQIAGDPAAGEYEAAAPITTAPAPAAPTRTTPVAPPPATASFSVTESGWSYISDGSFVSWGAVVTNDGPDWELVDVSATAFDADGFAIDTDTVTLMRLPTGQMAFGGIFTQASAIADVQVAIADDGVSYEENNRPVTGTVTAEVRLQGAEFDAVLSANFTSSVSFAIDSGNPFFTLYRNAGGAIVGGGWGYLPAAIPARGQASMALQDAGQLLVPPTATSAEVYVDTFEGF